jgi:hypothetical protein
MVYSTINHVQNQTFHWSIDVAQMKIAPIPFMAQKYFFFGHFFGSDN